MSFLPPLPPTFEAALRDVDAHDASYRLAAAGALSPAPEGRESDAAAAVAKLLGDPLAPVRLAALDAAARLEAPSLREHCASLADDPHAGVREAAVHAASALGVADETLLGWARETDPPLRVGALHALVSRGARVPTSVFVAALDAEFDTVRMSAASAIGALGLTDGADALAARLDDVPSVAAAAALALADLEDERAIPPLLKMLRQGSFDAAEALGQLDLGDHDEVRRELAYVAGRFFAPLLLKAAASASLARNGDERGVEGLRGVLRALRSDARAYAVSQVASLGLRELRPELERLLRRPRGVHPDDIRDALARLATPTPDPA